MADAENNECRTAKLKKCSRCEQFKELEEFAKRYRNVSDLHDGRHSICRRCVNARNVRRYAECQDVAAKGRSSTKAWMAKRFTSDYHRELWRAQKRRARRRKGAEPIEARRARAASKAVQKDAREAWVWWLKHAPDDWMRQYYEAMGKPWANPRIHSSEQYRLRYAGDPLFAQRERERASAKRFRNPEYARVWSKDGTRWRFARDSSDGSITDELLRTLRSEKHCAYCFESTRSRDRELDHVWPLSKGGTHSADNLVMACKTCNRKKRNLLPLQWLTSFLGSSQEIS